MPKKKIEQAEVTEVEEKATEETTETEVVETETTTGKSKTRVPFALAMVLAIGVALALIVTVFGDKTDTLVDKLEAITGSEETSVIAETDVSATESAVDIFVTESVQAEDQLAAPATGEVVDTATESTAASGSSTTDSPFAGATSPMPYAMPPHVAQMYKDMQEQRRLAFERDMQRQKDMMTDMFEIRKTVFKQAEKRRQEVMERMQERQAEMEKHQMEILKRRQQAFERAMQRT